jgi:hypothetical protein
MKIGEFQFTPENHFAIEYHKLILKVGMGSCHHDGNIYVAARDDVKREFILLASRSGEEIARQIEKNGKNQVNFFRQ